MAKMNEPNVILTATVNTDKFYVGDPCYVMAEEDYDAAFTEDENGNLVSGETIIGLVHYTEYGDGFYDGYSVDAGILCIIDANKLKNDNNADEYGTIFEVEPGEHTISLEYHNGSFEFSIDDELIETIFTGDTEDEDDDCFEDDWFDADDVEINNM